MTKNPLTYGLIAAALLLSSCTASVVFEDPMPRQSQLLKEIPRQFHGTWIDENEDPWIVQSAGILTDGKLMKNNGETQIRTEDNHMFVNVRYENGWELYIAEVDGSTMDVYSLDIDDDRLFKKLGRMTDLDITYDEEGERKTVRLNPTDQEFRKMVRRKFFTHQGTLTRN
jgi:hypothetical protein